MDQSGHPDQLDELLVSMDRRGRDFERLCAWFLRSDPEYAAEFTHVWLWEDWPGNWGRDKGIDLIAQTVAGRIVAIQAKHYAPIYAVKKSDVDSFLAESSRDAIDERLLIATTDLLGTNAQEVIDGQSKPVSLCFLSRLRVAAVSWPTSVGELTAEAPLVLQTRPHQNAALEAIAEWASDGGRRAQVLMACGTGKTLVAVRAAELLRAESVLVLVPTLPLLRQTAGAWAAQSSIRRKAIRVCSDKHDSESEDVATRGEVGFPTTTSADDVARFLRASGPKIIFCTYASSPTIAEAMAAVPDAGLDLVVADEAHRCAGAARKPSKTVLDEDAIRARRRLFFTATPTLFGPKHRERARNVNVTLASMDDPELFGPVIYHLSFADAVAQGLLCPYQVVVIPIRDDEVQTLIDRRQLVTADGTQVFEAAALATQIACARAMRKYGARRIVAFHPRIADSRRFAEHFRTAAGLMSDHDRPTGGVWAAHVDGRWMPRAKRIRVLREFEQQSDDARLLCNVRLLTEGVDVPAIDGIAFVDTHRGSVSVIQAVGRAMRPADGKHVGTIILPIIVRHGEDIPAALSRREHRPIVEILGALRSHDPEIFRSLDELRFTAGTGDPEQSIRRFVIDAPVDVDQQFADAVDVALTRALGTAALRRPRRRVSPLTVTPDPADRRPLPDDEVLARGMDVLNEYSEWRLAPAVPSDVSGFPLGSWWSEIKTRWNDGTIEAVVKSDVADAVSWLAPDLGPPQSRIRAELRALTHYGVPEQLDVQLSRQGVHATGPLRSLCGPNRDFSDDDGLLERLDEIHAAVTHAAMSPRMQLHSLVAAVRPLVRALDAAVDDESGHQWGRSAILYGYTDRVQQDKNLQPHWSVRSDPESYVMGWDAAASVVPWVRRMALYGFDGDEAEVDALRDEEIDRSPDARLDALGWDIFLLARSRDLPYSQALRMAQGTARNSLATRQATRKQLIDNGSHPRGGRRSGSRATRAKRRTRRAR